MIEIGQIVQLNVQQRPVKVGVTRYRRYDASAIVSVPAIALDGRGVIGLAADGTRILDVHHPDHPQSRFRGDNALSVIFSGHYSAMRDRFGDDHLPDGSAGETMLVAFDDLVGDDALRGGLIVAIADGAQLQVNDVWVATPCVEFARYCLRYPNDVPPDLSVTDALAYLNDGMRGYYATYSGPPVTIRMGD